MENKMRLIDANDLMDAFRRYMVERYDEEKCVSEENCKTCKFSCLWRKIVSVAPTVDAVEVPDKELLKAINLLIKQYEHSKNSEYVHHPVAHALFHTWRQLDKRRD